MLGVVIANSLLLLFVCWEIVGLTSYLLIGFWYHKPSAAAAAKKAFITTRIGDLGLLLGMVWLYAQTGTLNFYDHGNGCLEAIRALAMVTQATIGGMAVSTAIGLLIFLGAVGKSGQLPLHVWLPDAMEGPTPVSALIHAATMVAAGVFLVARVYPLMAAGLRPEHGVPVTTALTGRDLGWRHHRDFRRVHRGGAKRHQTHPRLLHGFAARLHDDGPWASAAWRWACSISSRTRFSRRCCSSGSGSVIHGCHEEQDIRKMGGLKKFMPVTFATYAIGMLALAGFPLFFSGFWSKDEILHAAHGWPVSHIPFYLGCAGRAAHGVLHDAPGRAGVFW
jgi:NADH-quinone oxidoreductase subunit L